LIWICLKYWQSHWNFFTETEKIKHGNTEIFSVKLIFIFFYFSVFFKITEIKNWNFRTCFKVFNEYFMCIFVHYWYNNIYGYLYSRYFTIFQTSRARKKLNIKKHRVLVLFYKINFFSVFSKLFSLSKNSVLFFQYQWRNFSDVFSFLGIPFNLDIYLVILKPLEILFLKVYCHRSVKLASHSF
jgi:hypothetical protein